MKRPCSRCRQLIDSAQYERHLNAHRNSAEGKRDLSWSNKEWQRIRRRALERDGHKCRRCGTTKARLKMRGEYLQVHHIVPASKGGSDDLANLLVLCPACHGDVLLGSNYGPRESGMY